MFPRDVPTRLVDLVHGQTEGNPLFVGEIGRMLWEDSPEDISLASTSMPRIKVPESIRGAIGTRLNRLPVDCNRVLGVAAVIGREFAVKHLITQLKTLGPDRILHALELAQAAQVLDPVAHSPGRFRFRHALIRETLYAEHGAVHRATLHRQIGELLEAAYTDDLEPHLSQLAYHYCEAAQAGKIERIDKAVTYTLQAGQHALAMLAYDEAVTNFELALQVLGLEQEPDTERRFHLLFALGDAHNKARYLNESSQTLLSAASLALRKEWWPLLAETAITFQIVLCKAGSSHPAVVPMHETALRHAPETDLALRARLLASLSDAFHYTGEHNRADTVARKGLEIARNLDDPGLLTDSQRIAEDIDLHPLLAKIQLLQETDFAGAEGLSARELEVVQLIADGASNQQIAKRLFISHSTVATHVRNIFGKTGAANRTEAVAYARRANLLGGD